MPRRIRALVIALAILYPAFADAANVGVVCVSETKTREILRFNFDTTRKLVLSGGFDGDPFPPNEPLQVAEDTFTWDTKLASGTTYHFVLDRTTLVLNFVKKKAMFGDVPFNFHSVCQLNQKQL